MRCLRCEQKFEEGSEETCPRAPDGGLHEAVTWATDDIMFSPDATVWAKAFQDLIVDGGVTIDEGLMIGWFANALECGRRVGIEAATKAWPMRVVGNNPQSYVPEADDEEPLVSEDGGGEVVVDWRAINAEQAEPNQRIRDALADVRVEVEGVPVEGTIETTQLAPVPGEKGGARFHLWRHTDVTGSSGRGLVAWGIVWPDGTAAVRWKGDFPTTVVHHDRGMASVRALHGHGGLTSIVMVDACPDDTNGDGDCGKRLCPWCAGGNRWDGRR